MYRRYTNTDREGASPNRFKQTLVRDIIILVLLAGLVVLLIYAIPALSNQGKERDILIQKIRAEADEATRKMNALSSYGKETAEAEVLSHLYAIRVLNETYMAQEGRLLIPEEDLNACITQINNYIDDSSQSGKNLTIILSDLRNAMDQLNYQLTVLQ